MQKIIGHFYFCMPCRKGRYTKVPTEQTKQNGLRNSTPKDSSAKKIFGDSTLCAQFLRDYVDIPMLKTVRPEDIEDVTTRYLPMFSNERDSDIVKRIHIKNDETPFFLISLIEHKSNVDYNVVMQMFRYIAFIWADYEKEMEKQHEGISKTKGFRYPPVLPIVFYDGPNNWTAATKMHDRVLLSDVLGEYIPDYRCILVQLKDYSNQELMDKENELSVIMMVDKIKDKADYDKLSDDYVKKYINDITANAPEYLLTIISDIVEILLNRLNIPTEEVDAFTAQIKERKMGELLAHFKGWDVQAARREGREEARKEAREEAVMKLIRIIKKFGYSEETAKLQLIDEYELSEKEAAEKVEMYWQS